MIQRKRTGQIGPVVGSVDTEWSVPKDWRKIPFPEQKPEIEMWVANRWAKDMDGSGEHVVALKQNEENNIDFSVQVEDRIIALELSEFVFKLGSSGNPYNKTLNDGFCARDMADQMFEAMMVKSRRYGGPGVWLLMYVTHWAFSPCEDIVEALQYRMTQESPLFEKVYFLDPKDERDSVVTLLYPTNRDFTGYDAKQFDGLFIVPMDPSTMSFGIDLDRIIEKAAARCKGPK